MQREEQTDEVLEQAETCHRLCQVAQCVMEQHLAALSAINSWFPLATLALCCLWIFDCKNKIHIIISSVWTIRQIWNWASPLILPLYIEIVNLSSNESINLSRQYWLLYYIIFIWYSSGQIWRNKWLFFFFFFNSNPHSHTTRLLIHRILRCSHTHMLTLISQAACQERSHTHAVTHNAEEEQGGVKEMQERERNESNGKVFL